ncbi:hypothetical protein [Leptolyngbya sp. FACHB-261]|uniref:hypothetical protein n=1 Tax=Leptolyngbya sp. FACHB-261 TaxID=2692806 RepID=UPI0016845AF1|nr:hypothetical protein [Leptolyngbya sp. FACHB-261]MBD2103401.1 hypothetical protein [Leptolyngbya sp. FACHB-261]
MSTAGGTDAFGPAGRVQVSLDLDPQLVAELAEFSDDPSQLVEQALRQWLRNQSQTGGGFEGDRSRELRSNPPVPLRGEWND